MRLELYRHRWGVADPLEAWVPRCRQLGYAGVEVWLGGLGDLGPLARALQDHQMGLIALVATTAGAGQGQAVSDHLASLELGLEQASFLGPALVNIHGGHDGWGEAEQDDFFGEALSLIRRLGVRAAFETHRGRPTFSPWATDRLLRAFPELQLTVDFSHWVVVCERLIEDQREVIARAAGAALHVHARVGHEQGPQVSDPRAPEFAAHLQAHEGWWDLVWEAQEGRGLEVSTLTPEFGPPPYLPTLPHSGQPVADLAEVCEWMSRRQRSRFADRARAG
ncbi:MAG: TIM barrel protein [Meiothermus sp.]|nr:TIM barrel protein [Meiothermus sp.]